MNISVIQNMQYESYVFFESGNFVRCHFGAASETDLKMCQQYYFFLHIPDDKLDKTINILKR